MPPNFWPTTLFSGFSHTTDRKVPSEVVLMGSLCQQFPMKKKEERERKKKEKDEEKQRTKEERERKKDGKRKKQEEGTGKKGRKRADLEESSGSSEDEGNTLSSRPSSSRAGRLPSWFRKASNSDSSDTDDSRITCGLCGEREPQNYSGKFVYWIDCDKCGAWFHTACSGSAKKICLFML